MTLKVRSLEESSKALPSASTIASCPIPYLNVTLSDLSSFVSLIVAGTEIPQSFG
ncbi:TPA: hypothetical protein ACF0RA_002558 [Enterococcus hirae]|uniref:hypothetical protein n=1 Tax=Enterococcus TaxID=1350 RepID=UPI0015F27DFF|nr:hypothetical protein [Enterococcus hirae]MBA5270739.1 hypothetical protein [Enterococcus hirae]MDU1933123.1 hypothetical protein [Enterococcus hirae]